MAKDPVKAHDEYVNDVLKEKMMQGKAGTMYIPEIFEAVGMCKTAEERIKILHANNKPALQIVLRVTIDPEIKFNFTLKELKALDIQPMDIPDFDTAPITLLSEGRRIVDLTNRKKGVQLSKEKSLKLAQEMLSALHPNDQEVFYQMVGKKFKFKGLTERLILQAFPNLMPIKKENSLPFNGNDDGNEDNENTDETGDQVSSERNTDSDNDTGSESTGPETISDMSGTQLETESGSDDENVFTGKSGS